MAAVLAVFLLPALLLLAAANQPSEVESPTDGPSIEQRIVDDGIQQVLANASGAEYSPEIDSARYSIVNVVLEQHKKKIGKLLQLVMRDSKITAVEYQIIREVDEKLSVIEYKDRLRATLRKIYWAE